MKYYADGLRLIGENMFNKGGIPMKQITHPAILRARAWEAMKATWLTVLVLSCAIHLVSSVLNQLVIGLPEPVSMILSFVITAAMMVPMLGVTKGMLGYFRGKLLSFDCVKGMFPHAWKVIRFYLWELLCIMGWTLPGAAVMVVGGTMLNLGTDGTATVAFGGLLTVAGLVLMLVLAFRAALNYSMSQCILIDAPSTGARETLRKSKEMIRGYRWYSVKVEWPVFAIILVAGFVVGGLTAALPVWLASLISAGLACFTSMFSYYFLPVMYVELRRIGR